MNNWHLNIFATLEEPQVTSLGQWPGMDFLGIALPCTKALRKRVWLRFNGITCYAQVYDVGPWVQDDFDYVFGDSRPRAETLKGLPCPRVMGTKLKASIPDVQGFKDIDLSNGAGLDLFPATAKALGITDNVYLDWCFAD